jgi:hypothetical protein
MNRINEFNLETGTYEHYKGNLYVVTEVVTHADNETTGKMEALADPLVVYRDLEPAMEHVNGRHQYVHKRYCRKLSEFKAEVMHNGEKVKRFKLL